MSEVIVFDSEDATLLFHPESGIVHHRFKHSARGEGFREVLTEGLALLEDPAVDKWLSDERLNLDLPVEDREWADEWWQPRAIAMGWKYWAVVLPAEALGVVEMATHINEARREGVVVSVFFDAGTALAWLESLSVTHRNRDAEG
jgi:hypothetical protein